MKHYTQNEKVLHTIYRMHEEESSGKLESRVDFTSEDKFLQVAAIKIPNQKSFRPHQHITCKRETDMTQESWVIMRGRIDVVLYDEEGQIMGEEILREGDCMVTFYGGHSFKCMEENTLVYEFKTGPYFGREADKVFLDEEN
jgi:cupin fold WbuC family metalloprotein